MSLGAIGARLATAALLRRNLRRRNGDRFGLGLFQPENTRSEPVEEFDDGPRRRFARSGLLAQRFRKSVALESEVGGQLAHQPVPLDLAGLDAREAGTFILNCRLRRPKAHLQIPVTRSDLAQPA